MNYSKKNVSILLILTFSQDLFNFWCFFHFVEALSLYEYKHSHIKYHSIILQKYIPETGKYPIFRAISIKTYWFSSPNSFFHPKIHDTLSCSSVWTEKEKKSYSHPIYWELCVPEMNWSGEGITLYSWEYPSKKSWFDPKSGVAITAPDSIIKITSKSHKNCSGPDDFVIFQLKFRVFLKVCQQSNIIFCFL